MLFTKPSMQRRFIKKKWVRVQQDKKKIRNLLKSRFQSRNNSVTSKNNISPNVIIDLHA